MPTAVRTPERVPRMTLLRSTGAVDVPGVNERKGHGLRTPSSSDARSQRCLKILSMTKAKCRMPKLN